MPIINLTLRGKQTTGDGTEIVCMNSDYVVKLKPHECAEFLALPIKKLILKYGNEYKESPIESVVSNGQTTYQAKLPVFGYQPSVELGVYGKETEDGNPSFSSMSTVFKCVKSILCGAVVLKEDPTLAPLDVRWNGTYSAADYGVDGFHEVDVYVASGATEERTVNLDMSNGNQVILPQEDERTMTKVTVQKPYNMTPENIRAGVTIGGVAGTYEKVLVDTEVFMDGEYTPPAGADGFSKVTVNVGSTHHNKVLKYGESFTYDYDHSVNVTIDTPGVIKYENDGNQIIITGVSEGNCSLILKDLDLMGNVIATLHYAIHVSREYANVMPEEVDNVSTMQLYLESGIVGAVLKYVGPTSAADGLVNGGLYVIEEDA